ncbi:30S ribosomal protein S16 [Fibrella aestuarina BUZ 2]|uniref:Small ribosomal subunit protein bS16 n=1 Tax=Fibrella aestuarina BUZ 2 TaxID=1166018 RepID=I0KBH2_9BACT|nr:30S ribosomal protein S16 [Fibrella aestuarina]CCH01475.1 30S ribosomal protein S16 [Fibrella aestuarina BUZ 2]
MLKIRLARRGRKKMAMYDIVVAESTSPRDGRFVEKIGTYNPNLDPARIVLNNGRAVHWLMVGAQPTDTTRAILSHEGVMLQKHLQVGVVKGAITQDQADAKLADWKENKAGRKADTADVKKQAADKARQERLAAEQQVNAARAEAIAAKYKVEEPVAEEAPADEAPAAAETEEAPAAEASTDETAAE